MRTITATEASRSFAALLDDAERGETVVVTRGGRRIATIGPAAAHNGAEVLALLAAPAPDADFAADVAAAARPSSLNVLPSESAAGEGTEWPAD